jgi:hypothetical protein
MKTPKPLVTADQLLALLHLMTLARHGKAPSVQGVADGERRLSDLGERQALELKKYHASHFAYDIAMSSPLVRAVETSQIALESQSRTGGILAVEILGVSSAPKEPLNIMFAKLGYSPLKDYFAHELGDHLKVWAHEALAEILKVATGRGNRIFVGGHAVCQPAIVWAISEVLATKPEYQGTFVMSETSLQANLGEAEALTVILTPAGASIIEFCNTVKA